MALRVISDASYDTPIITLLSVPVNNVTPESNLHYSTHHSTVSGTLVQYVALCCTLYA